MNIYKVFHVLYNCKLNLYFGLADRQSTQLELVHPVLCGVVEWSSFTHFAEQSAPFSAKNDIQKLRNVDMPIFIRWFCMMQTLILITIKKTEDRKLQAAYIRPLWVL